jgi:hypothetical protein
MKLKLFSVLALSGLIAAGVACGESETDDDGEGGSGGSGGETGTTKATTTATKASTGTGTGTTGTGTTATGTSTTSAGSCDMGTCDECQQCAFAADCSSEADACAGNPECLALNMCIGMCPANDQACVDQCFADHPEGEADLGALAQCVFCDACFVTCDGAGAGC